MEISNKKKTFDRFFKDMKIKEEHREICRTFFNLGHTQGERNAREVYNMELKVLGRQSL